MTGLVITPIGEIKDVVDQLAELGIDALHLRADAKKVGDPRPDVSLWVTYRTEFLRVCEAFGVKAQERRFAGAGRREWFAERDTATRRLLIQCVSFEHHHDWEPRPRTDQEGM
jgi:hypothetical protein